MKEDHHHPHHDHNHQHHLPPRARLHHNNNFLSNLRTTTSYYKPTAYIILLILTYTLGYFSASSSSSTHNNNTYLITASTAPPTVIRSPGSDHTSTNAPYPIKTVLSPLPPPPPTCPDTEGVGPHYRFPTRCADPVRPGRVRQKILDSIYNGTSPYDNFPPPHMAHLLRPNRVKGWGSYGPVFKNLITKYRPNTIIEVGTFLGASAIHMAELTRQLGLQTQILCLDDFRGWPGFRNKVNYAPILNGDVLLLPQFLQNVMYFNLTGSVLPVPFSTGSGLDKLCEWGVVADLIEVDAGHDFHSAWADINRAHKLLRRPGGVIFGHDYFTGYDNRGVRRAVDLFARVHGFKVDVDGEHWVIHSS